MTLSDIFYGSKVRLMCDYFDIYIPGECHEIVKSGLGAFALRYLVVGTIFGVALAVVIMKVW